MAGDCASSRMTQDVRPQSKEWYDLLASRQSGYHYPWRSRIDARNGEAAYTSLVTEHLTPQLDVIDCGCGHGADALWVASEVRSVVGFDRVGPYLELAERTRLEQGLANVRFVLADSSAAANSGTARLPVPDQSIDLFLSRRGPRNWVADARRAGRPSAVLIQLNPVAGDPPTWNEELPDALQMETAPGARVNDLLGGLLTRLSEAGANLVSWQAFDVPEWLDSPEDLYTFLAWGRIPTRLPAYPAVRSALDGVFSRHATQEGLAIRHRRFLSKAVLARSPR